MAQVRRGKKMQNNLSPREPNSKKQKPERRRRKTEDREKIENKANLDRV